MYNLKQPVQSEPRASERMANKRSKHSVGSGKQQARRALGQIDTDLIPGMKQPEVSGGEAVGSYRTALNSYRESMSDAKTSSDLKNMVTEPVSDEGPATLSALTKKLYGKKGTETGDVVSHSYYNDPISEEGFTRNAGGAPKESQEEAIKTIIRVGRSLEATDDEIAYALATARYESGFNKFAAAKSSSAYGLGQFINKTGEAYGLSQENRDDIEMQAQALVEHVLDNFAMAEKKGLGTEYVYALHHDGPALDRDGLQKSRKNVMPFLAEYKKVVENF
jgi:hypothetical protein